MAESYDMVIAGGGHNGLIVGAYLAKSGLNVCVVEQQAYVGGGVATRELTVPGFRHDVCSMGHIFIQPNPLIRKDELQLFSKYGLKYLYPDEQVSVIFSDGQVLEFYKNLDRTCEQIAKFSEKDAETYRKFHDWSIKTLDLLTEGMFNPPPPFGSFVSLLDGSEEGRGLLRSLFVSSLDICNEWFESDYTKIALTRWASEGMIAPQTKGTGNVLFIFIPVMHKYGMAIPEGGSGALSEALERCLIDLGATVRTSCPVKEFKVVGGKCMGVILESGEEILAKKGVVTNFNVKQVFPNMIQGAKLPDGFTDKVEKISFSDYQAFHMELALNEAPNYKCGTTTSLVEHCSADMVEYLRGFDDLVYGIPRTDFPVVHCPTRVDPTRAPKGKHCLYIYHYAPYDLRDGGGAKWDQIADEYIEGLLAEVRSKTTNMGDENILGRWHKSPLDYERYNPAWPHGDFTHIGGHIYQAVGNRPLPGWSQYRTPIEKLYMCGPSTHPGMGVLGAGRAAVQIVMEDLKIDFEKIIT